MTSRFDKSADGPSASRSDCTVRLGDLGHLKEVLQQVMKEKETEGGSPPINSSGGNTSGRVLDITSVTPDSNSQYEWAFEVKQTDVPFSQLIQNPARTWPFELDSFQKQAVYYLEAGMNVFVAAHTSAGKTVIAEYAIAMAERFQGRVIYTSPIKALSNQKFSDFRSTFRDVGLITGDLQVNEEGRCLIMTTEILRSMLSLGTHQVQDLQFVIFDEVHYINDPERGHIWEETLILLPAEVQIVMLSATVPNAMQFANWLGSLKRRRVAVSRTSLRPVPLHYYLYVGDGRLVMKIKVEDKFLIKQYDAAKEFWEEVKPVGRVPNYKRMKFFWVKLIRYLTSSKWIPAVVFSLSRKKCDFLAELASSAGLVLTTTTEQHKISVFMKSQIAKLDKEDQNLRQIMNMEQYLKCGIAAHHSGILPILKEIVEVLFAKGLVKVLFATETFAVGVNMPAKTVVFEDISKFDGCSRRLLKPAEFIQMAGRAGRRGQDDCGTVLLLTGGHFPSEHDLNAMMMGTPSELASQFRLGYTMILTTLRSKGELTVADILIKSYKEHGEQSKMSNYRAKLEAAKKAEMEARKDVSSLYDRKTIDVMNKFFENGLEYLRLWDSLRPQMLANSKLAKLIVIGRIVIINYGQYINCPAVIARIENRPQTGDKVYTVIAFKPDQDLFNSWKQGDNLVSDEWLRLASLVPNVTSSSYKGLDSANDDLAVILTVGSSNIVGIVNSKPTKASIITDGLADRERVMKSFKKSQISEKFRTALIPLSNYQIKGRGECINETQLKMDDIEFGAKVEELWILRAQLSSLTECFANTVGLLAYKKCFNWFELKQQVSDLNFRLSVESMSLYPDYLNKLKLLKDRQYISENDTVELKGNMASQLGKYELLITEILVSNILAEVSCEEVAAAFSCLVCHLPPDEQIDIENDKDVPDSLKQLIGRIKEVIKDLSTQEQLMDIGEVEGAELSKINFMFVKPIYNWAKGMNFGEVMETMCNIVQEGLLVRAIQQLLEVLKDVESAARLMGDPQVLVVVEAASRAIKRGIVFSPSIYTTMKGEDQPVEGGEAQSEMLRTEDDDIGDDEINEDFDGRGYYDYDDDDDY